MRALASEFQPWQTKPENLLVPSNTQFELYKWGKRESG